MSIVSSQITAEDEKLRRWMQETADEHGVAVMRVAEEEGGAPFAFTVGGWRRFGVPEAIVIGLAPEVAEAVLRIYAARAAAGDKFRPGQVYDGFLDECEVTFENVAEPFYLEYLGHAFLMYRKGNFPAVQILIGLPGGVFPWHEEAPGGFAEWQPVLTESGRPESWTPGEDGP